MTKTQLNQWTIIKSIEDDYLITWIEAFIIDRKAQGMSNGTIYFYQRKLELLMKYLEGNLIKHISEITPSDIRQYIFYLQDKGHNLGGVHACFRALKTFLRWYEDEAEPDGWKNPINKIKAPKLAVEPLEPVEIEDVKKMLLTCNKGNFYGERDRAILMVLLDTGVRANELIGMNIEDLDIITGSILIRIGKGRKPRMVYLGKKTRRSIRSYLKQRCDDNHAIWISGESERLTYWGLRAIIRRRAKNAGKKYLTYMIFAGHLLSIS